MNKLDIKKMEELININDASRRYFFNKADKKWLEPLQERGYFDFEKLNRITKDNEDDLLPPDVIYLKRMASESPDEVANILLKGEIKEEYVFSFIFQLFLISAELPAEQIGRLVQRKWLERVIRRKLGLRNEIQGSDIILFEEHFFGKLYKAEDYNNAFSILHSLLLIILENDSLSSDYAFGRHFRFPDFEEKESCQCFALFIDIFLDIINSRKSAFELFSFWDESAFGKRKIIKPLVRKLESCAEKCTDIDSIHTILHEKLLRITPKDNPLFFQFRIFVLALFRDSFRSEIRETLLYITEEKNSDIFFGTNPDDKYIAGARIEFTFILKNLFDILSDDEKNMVVGNIIHIFTKRNQKLSDDQIYYGSKIFSFIQEYMTDEQKKNIQTIGFSLEEKVEPIEIFPYHKYNFEISELQAGAPDPIKGSIPKLIEKLQEEWHPRNMKEVWIDKKLITPNGIGRDLRDNIVVRFPKYLQHAEGFFDKERMPSLYTYHFFSGVQDFIKKEIEEKREAKKKEELDDDFSPILKLCMAIVKSGEEEEFTDENIGTADKYKFYWKGMHMEMATILNELIQYCNQEFFKQHRNNLFTIIQYLLTNKQPTVKDESPGTSIMDRLLDDGSTKVDNPFTIAVNTIRGLAFQTLVTFAWKDYNHTKEINDDIKEEYERLIENEKTKSIWFLFGHYLHFFYIRDKEWLVGLVPKIFPDDNKDFYLIAWEGYLAYPKIDKNMFFDEVFQKIYTDNLNTEKQGRDMEYTIDPAERLGEYLAIAFIGFEEFDFNHPLFEKFFNNETSITARRSFVRSSGKRIKEVSESEKINNKEMVKERLVELYDYLIREVDKEVLYSMGSWIYQGSKLFSQQTFVENILKLLEKTKGRIYLDPHSMGKILLKLVNDSPEQVFDITRLYLNEDNEINYADVKYSFLEVFKSLQESKMIDKTEFKSFISTLLLRDSSTFSSLSNLPH